MAGREKGGACKQSAHYPAHLLKKLFLVGKCQDIKWCSIAGLHMLDMFVRLYACKADWLMTAEVNCHNWPI